MRKALSTLPWVEPDTMVADTGSRPPTVRFAVKNKKAFNLDEVKKAIEGQTKFKVGKVVSGP